MTETDVPRRQGTLWSELRAVVDPSGAPSEPEAETTRSPRIITRYGGIYARLYDVGVGAGADAWTAR